MPVLTNEDIERARYEELTVSAVTHLDCWVTCPHCSLFQNQIETLGEHFDHNELRAEDCYAELNCEECGEEFYVNHIEF